MQVFLRGFVTTRQRKRNMCLHLWSHNFRVKPTKSSTLFSFLSPLLACSRSSCSAEVSVYSPFEQTSLTSLSEVLVREMPAGVPPNMLLLVITWKGKSEILLWSFGHYAMAAECLFVPVTEALKYYFLKAEEQNTSLGNTHRSKFWSFSHCIQFRRSIFSSWILPFRMSCGFFQDGAQ